MLSPRTRSVGITRAAARSREGRRGSDAFSLLELLVVLAVIALLVGILAPALRQAREAARLVICGSNIRQLGTANQYYVNEYGRFVPFSQFAPNITNMSGGKGVNVRWCWSDDTPGAPLLAFRNGLLARYLKNSTEIAGCPCFTTPQSMVDMYQKYGMAYPVAVHYGYNGLLLGIKHENFYATNAAVHGYRAWVGYRPSEIRNAASKVMFADAGQLVVSQVAPNPTISPPITVTFRSGLPRAKAAATIHARHAGGRANVAWVDGHVSAEQVRFYDDQLAVEKTLRLGFLAPHNGGERSNEWMFVRED